jgi:hypothetical protein
LKLCRDPDYHHSVKHWRRPLGGFVIKFDAVPFPDALTASRAGGKNPMLLKIRRKLIMYYKIREKPAYSCYKILQRIYEISGAYRAW